MNDYQQDLPLPKTTPRNNNNSSALDNIVVNLQRVPVNVEREKQPKSVQNKETDTKNDIHITKQNQELDEKVQQIEMQQVESIKSQQDKLLLEVSNDNLVQTQQKNIVQNDCLQGDQQDGDNMIERSARLLEPSIQQDEELASNQVALQISNSYKESKLLQLKNENNNEDGEPQITVQSCKVQAQKTSLMIEKLTQINNQHQQDVVERQMKRDNNGAFPNKKMANQQKEQQIQMIPKQSHPSQRHMKDNRADQQNQQQQHELTISQPEPSFPHNAIQSYQGNIHLHDVQVSHQIENQIGGYKHRQHEQMTDMRQQQEQCMQMQPSFDLDCYKRVQPLLEELLALLKHSLKVAKQQQTKPKIFNLNNDNDNTTPKNINHPPLPPNNTNNINSRFFKQSRSQSRTNSIHNKNLNTGSNGLMDILERRKQGKNEEDRAFIANKNQQQKVNMIGGRPKQIPYGLGNFGGGMTTHYAFKNTHQQLPNMQVNPLEQNRYELSEQQLQQQKIIQNRNKINEILASSVSNFKNSNAQQQYLQQSKKKIASFFAQQEKLPQGISNDHNNQRRYVADSSFYNESETSKSTNAFHSRKIIKSMNFNKIVPNNKIISTTTQIPSQQVSIEGRQQRSSSFFHQPMTEKPSLLSLTPILKVIKKYLQIVAQGKIDDIESIVGCEGNLQMTTSLNDMIGRKKIFKMAMYFERAAVVAGVCYGYLMTTQQRGVLRFQVEQLNPRFYNNNPQSQQNHNVLKEQSKLVLKYMINLVSFCLNNSKLITKTLETYYLQSSQLVPLNTEEYNQNLRKKQSPQQQLIEKQIFKRNIETIKLNVQYVQQTLQKMFSETYYLAKNYGIDQDFGESFKNVTKIVNKNSIQESFYTLLEYFSFYLSLAKRQRSIPFLAVAPNPYLDPTQRYTLVIDFISVFCHGSKKSKTFIFRPYSQHFLYEMSQYFDIVIICDALPQQIDKIIDILDPKGIIQHRLYRYHMVEQRITGKFTKNLQRIGRDLKRTLLLDVEENRMSEDAKNTIFINQWRGSKHDSTLAELCSVLISIVMQNLDCDRAGKVVNKQMNANRQKGIKFINFGLNLKQQIQNQSQSYGNQDLLRQSQRQFE